MSLWCWVGVAFCYSATCLLACLGVHRAAALAAEYRSLALDLLDEADDRQLVIEQLEAEGREVLNDHDTLLVRYKHQCLALEAAVDERNELRARLKRDQPRGKHGKYIKDAGE